MKPRFHGSARIWTSALALAGFGLGLGAAPPPPALNAVLPDPPPGKAIVAVACRKAVSGKLSECRTYASKSSGGPIPAEFRKEAAAKLEGQVMEPAKVEQVYMTGVIGDLPPPPADPPAPPAPPLKVDWLRKPSAGQMAAAYPSRATEAGVGGRVVLSCLVNKAGEVHSCLPVVETPANWGFGAAAMTMAPKFQMKTVGGDDGGEEGQVTIPLIFSPP